MDDNRILRYKTVWTNYDEAVKKIRSIVSADNLDIGKGFEKNLQKAGLVLKDAFTRIEEASKGGILDEQSSKTIYNQLNGLGRLIKNLAIQFGTIKLPEDLSKQVSEIEEAISTTQEKIKNTSNMLASARMRVAKNTDTGEMMLSKKSKASLFRHNVMPGETKAGQVNVDGQLFTTYNSLIEAAENGSQALKDKATEVFNYINNLKTDKDTTYLQEYLNTIDSLNKEIETLKKELDGLNSKFGETKNSKIDSKDFVEVGDVLDKVNSGINGLNEEEARQEVQSEKTTAQEKKSTEALESKQKALLGTAAKTVLYHNAVNMLKRMLQTATRVVKELDSAFTNMAVVTTMTREETWALLGNFQELAKETGKTTTEIANMATMFYQQGKNTTDVLKLTEAAAKAATIAGIDGSRSIDLLTNALNGFQMSATDAMEVSDKFASLAASAATDYEELAVALSKVASQANMAGMSMDFTLGMLTKGLEVTRRQIAA